MFGELNPARVRVRCGAVRCGAVRCDAVLCGAVRTGPDRPGFNPARVNLAWVDPTRLTRLRVNPAPG